MGLSLLIKTAAGCLPPNSGRLSPTKQWLGRALGCGRVSLPNGLVYVFVSVPVDSFGRRSVSTWYAGWSVGCLVCVGAVGARRSSVDYAEFVWSVSWLVRGGSCVLVFICGSLGCVRVYGLGLLVMGSGVCACLVGIRNGLVDDVPCGGMVYVKSLYGGVV